MAIGGEEMSESSTRGCSLMSGLQRYLYVSKTIPGFKKRVGSGCTRVLRLWRSLEVFAELADPPCRSRVGSLIVARTSTGCRSPPFGSVSYTSSSHLPSASAAQRNSVQSSVRLYSHRTLAWQNPSPKKKAPTCFKTAKRTSLALSRLGAVFRAAVVSLRLVPTCPWSCQKGAVTREEGRLYRLFRQFRDEKFFGDAFEGGPTPPSSGASSCRTQNMNLSLLFHSIR